jgi:CheY-like chemotaxis protein
MVKILVVEDKQENIEAAIEQLQGHDVDIATDYHTASRKIMGKFRQTEPTYDVVITDLFIPYTTKDWGPVLDKNRCDASPKSFGYNLLLLAVAQQIPHIGLLTDTNHHQNVESAAIDELDFMANQGKLKIGQSDVVVDLRDFGDPHYCQGVKNYKGALDHILKGNMR